MGWGNPFKDIGEAIFPQIPLNREILREWDGNQNDEQAAADQRAADANKFNYDMQKEFAQNGIRWKVEDAIAAGIHPLAALGAQGYSASPSAIASETVQKDRWLPKMLGQEVTRAALSTATADERAVSKLTQDRMMLENDILKIQRNNMLNPPIPSSHGDYLNNPFGMNDYKQRMINEVPLRRTMSDPLASHKEVGAIQDIQAVKTKRGYAIVPGADIKNRIEDSPMEWQWFMRNMLRTHRMPDGTLGIMNPVTGDLFRVPFTRKKKNGDYW